MSNSSNNNENRATTTTGYFDTTPSTGPDQKSTSTQGKKEIVSDEVKRKLADVSAALEYQSSLASNFIKIKDKETRVLKFLPEKTEVTLVKYPSSDKEVQRYKFFAYDLTNTNNNSSGNSNTNASTTPGEGMKGNPQEWTVSPTIARQLLQWFGNGFFTLSITREGSELRTRYQIMPLID